MVGAEILNRAFRKEFLNTHTKLVLLPACMRAQNEEACRMQDSPEGYLCARCTPACNVSELDRLGEEQGYEVRIIPHESSAFTKHAQDRGPIGIVGIACVLTLISGGWKARELGLVPQCVLLDYCGCKNH